MITISDLFGADSSGGVQSGIYNKLFSGGRNGNTKMHIYHRLFNDFNDTRLCNRQ
jgi:hypothetical protein